jgi:hypothetical protein
MGIFAPALTELSGPIAIAAGWQPIIDAFFWPRMNTN